MRRFFAAPLPSKHKNCVLERDVSHHILRVVGIAPDEKVELFDGKGNACVATLFSVREGLAEMCWQADITAVAQNKTIWVGLALTKKDAFSTTLRMLTELGVSHIVPIQASRSIVKGDKAERWQKIIHSAVAQSKQAKFPTLYPLQKWSDALRLMENVSQKFILHTTPQPILSSTQETAILIGPEGGFTEREIEQAIEQKWEVASISNSVLRADTAAVVAVTRLL